MLDGDSSPWNTYFGPTVTAIDAQGRPAYSPDLTQVDAEIISHWEARSTVAKHPVLRARYADLVWDLKAQAVQQRPDVQFAGIAIDAYLDGVRARFYKYPVVAVQALQRAIGLAVSTNDKVRIAASKGSMIARLDEVTEAREVASWTLAIDEALRNKELDLTPEETGALIAGLERLLVMCTATGPQFDPFAAEACARVLAAHYERDGQRDQIHRVIRSYGMAFEYLAGNASPTFAMGWLQPVIDEYHARGMAADADRVLRAYEEKGRRADDDLKTIQAPIEIPTAEFEQFLDEASAGSLRDCFDRISVRFVPKLRGIRDLLQELLSRTPILSRIPVTRIVDGHFAAQVGSIETDPDGRLILQLAQYMDGESLFLTPALRRIREKLAPDAAAILAILEESPIFDPVRHTLLSEGIEAYLSADHVKAIHVLIPEIEHALRRLLALMNVPILKAGRNGTTQAKNLNEVLREAAIQKVFGEDAQLYLLTLLADQRGQNIRNVVCHGFATPLHFNQQVADRVFHVLLTLARVRQAREPEGGADSSTASTGG